MVLRAPGDCGPARTDRDGPMNYLSSPASTAPAVRRCPPGARGPDPLERAEVGPARPRSSPARAASARRRPRGWSRRRSTARRADREPCGACTPCVEIAEGRAVDVVEIDAASNNGVDNVRDIVEAVKYRPARPLQGLRRGRGPHALHGRVQRAPEDARGAARAREVRARHDRRPQGPRDDPLALPAVRLPPLTLQQIVDQLAKVAEAEGMRSRPPRLRSSRGRRRAGCATRSLLDQARAAAGDSPDEAAVAEALGAVDAAAISRVCAALVRPPRRAPRRDRGAPRARARDEAGRRGDRAPPAERGGREARPVGAARPAGRRARRGPGPGRRRRCRAAHAPVRSRPARRGRREARGAAALRARGGAPRGCSSPRGRRCRSSWRGSRRSPAARRSLRARAASASRAAVAGRRDERRGPRGRELRHARVRRGDGPAPSGWRPPPATTAAPSGFDEAGHPSVRRRRRGGRGSGGAPPSKTSRRSARRARRC